MSRRTGKAWERLLEHANDGYRRDRKAVVSRVHPPVTVLSSPDQRTGAFRGFFAGTGPVDFLGYIVPSVQPVAFDAKDTTADRIQFERIDRHQAMLLEAYLPDGLPFLAIRIKAECFVVPWSRLSEYYWTWAEGKAERGEASLTVTGCSRIGWRMPSPGDWLNAIPPEVRGE